MHISRSIRFLSVALLLLLLSAASSAGVLISVSFGPPALPIYEQPLCPAPDYIWVPGYWAWSSVGYYWVPGTWALAPEPGLLWTPGYWAFDAGLYYWHPGYWAPEVGYYGGVVYGFGYTGTGYYGGYWRDRHFYYNRSVTNVNITNVRYVYTQRVNVTTVTRVSYNGGPGGTTARPTPRQLEVARRQVAPTTEQVKHEQTAARNRELLATENQGRPPVAATEKPADFKGHGALAASAPGAPYRQPEHDRVASPRVNPTTPMSESRPQPREVTPQVPKNRSRDGEMKQPAPETRQQVNTARPEIEQRQPTIRREPPPPPPSAGRENMHSMEAPPHPQREPGAGNAPRSGRELPQSNKEAHPGKAPNEKESHTQSEENRPH